MAKSKKKTSYLKSGKGKSALSNKKKILFIIWLLIMLGLASALSWYGISSGFFNMSGNETGYFNDTNFSEDIIPDDFYSSYNGSNSTSGSPFDNYFKNGSKTSNGKNGGGEGDEGDGDDGDDTPSSGGGGGSRPSPTCLPNWDCTNWACGENGSQIRICEDLNDCGTQNNFPGDEQTVEWECSEWELCMNGTENRTCTHPCNSTINMTYWPDLEQNCTNCTPNWNCTNEGLCVNGTQNITCSDMNFCNTTLNMPDLEQNCTNCTPNWNCTDWGLCVNGTQNITCSDMNFCNTTLNMPDLEQNCTVCVANWTCNDWGACVNETQNRTCWDVNVCNDTTDMPIINRTCVVPLTNDSVIVEITNLISTDGSGKAPDNITLDTFTFYANQGGTLVGDMYNNSIRVIGNARPTNTSDNIISFILTKKGIFLANILPLLNGGTFDFVLDTIYNISENTTLNFTACNSNGCGYDSFEVIVIKPPVET